MGCRPGGGKVIAFSGIDAMELFAVTLSNANRLKTRALCLGSADSHCLWSIYQISRMPYVLFEKIHLLVTSKNLILFVSKSFPLNAC